MPIALDPCWNEYALTDAEFVCDGVEADGLASDWGATVRSAETHGGVFVNPPWSNPMPWVQKCVAESHKDPRLDILLWLPLYPETKASKVIWANATRLCFWGRRINHLAPPIQQDGSLILGGEATQESGSKLPTWLVYFGPRPTGFEIVFKEYGTVVWGWIPTTAP